MRTILIPCLAATVVLSGTALAADNAPPEGFTALFNGKDFTGWQAKQGKVESEEEKAKWLEHWKVEEGTIKFDGQGPHLWTSNKYKDFDGNKDENSDSYNDTNSQRKASTLRWQSRAILWDIGNGVCLLSQLQ